MQDKRKGSPARAGRPRLSFRIVGELTSKDVGQLFATTDSERMKKTLEGAGFVQKGMSGSDHEENSRYGAKNE
jgi:hypothetical protein